MSEENINRDPNLATPSLQESGDDLQLPPPTTQESLVDGRQFQFHPPTVQNSLVDGRQFHPPTVQDSLADGRQFQFHPPTVQESIYGRPFLLPSLQESVSGRHQFQLPSSAVQAPYYRPQHPYYNFPEPNYVELTNLVAQMMSFQEPQPPYIQEPQPPYIQEPQPPYVQESRRPYIQEPQRPYIQEPCSLLPLPPLPEQVIPQPEEEMMRASQPWKKSTLYEVHTLDYLISKNINMISGELICRICTRRRRLEYNVKEKFEEVCKYIEENINQLDQKASKEWLKPKLEVCGSCKTGKITPVISEKVEDINWLFLMLGQMLGCCNVHQLRYLCDKNNLEKSCKKDGLLYKAYVVICRQLDPDLPFEL